ncbi:hypothetical protein BDY21DRAFT_358730 [Lineolata rhizophorae]|uniref:DUF7719 domain-containing protein n=1 Tax=Lineolata rhizophorae TaxID=578093 RepID=A0A6A6NMR2_9PEZI|nr:hypothetical protein BDY21DRAFT_358730 [Lineolata rhizophorae]
MSDTPSPRNRRERRAAARAAGHSPNRSPNIPMKKPDYDARPKGKTLYDLAAERQELLAKGTPFESGGGGGGDGATTVEDQVETIRQHEQSSFVHADEFGAVDMAVLYTAGLSMLHFMLDVLVYNQYRQNIEWPAIWGRTLRVAPMLFVIIYLLHTQTATIKLGLLRQVLFLGAAVWAGCYMIHAANRHGYFAVMKRVPPIGTLWVWSVIEMQLWFAVASVITVGGFYWWGGYEAF